jgi:NB-ARC domain
MSLSSRPLPSLSVEPTELAPSQVPASSGVFYGRNEELSLLCKYLNPEQEFKSKSPSSQNRVVLWGLAGFGKTKIALQFREQYEQCYRYTLWINAANYIDSFKEAVDEIESIDPDFVGTRSTAARNDNQFISFVHRWLKSKAEGWLMILDSVDESEGFRYQKLLPPCRHGTILVTTRRLELAETWRMENVEISEISEDAGSALLLENLPPRLQTKDGMIPRLSSRLL